MKVNTIRFDTDFAQDRLEAELLGAFEHAAMLGLKTRLALHPRDFLEASQFTGRGDSGAVSPTVEKHILIPGYRKLILSAGDRTVGISSLLPRGPLPIPVEAFLSLTSVETGDVKIDRWAEVSNTVISNVLGTLENAISAVIAMSWFELGVNRAGLNGFVFSEEPKCLLKLLARAGIEKQVVTKSGGPVWILIPPKESVVTKFLASVREVFIGVPALLPADVLENLIRFRPSILETLTPDRRKAIGLLYPRERAYQQIFTDQFLQSLKQTERFVINFPSKIQWENQFEVSGSALDISESGIRFRTDGTKVPEDALRDITMKLQVDPLHSVQLIGQIRRISGDGLECGIVVNPNSVQFKFLVDWLKRSPFAQKTKS